MNPNYPSHVLPWLSLQSWFIQVPPQTWHGKPPPPARPSARPGLPLPLPLPLPGPEPDLAPPRPHSKRELSTFLEIEGAEVVPRVEAVEEGGVFPEGFRHFGKVAQAMPDGGLGQEETSRLGMPPGVVSLSQPSFVETGAWALHISPSRSPTKVILRA